MYDYGWRNKKVYGQSSPPEYDLSKITNQHIVLMSSKNDKLADPEDVNLLRSKLTVKPVIDYIVPYDKFTHTDFLVAMNASFLVNSVVIQALDTYA